MTECAYINMILNMPPVLNMLKFWIWRSSEYWRVLNMRALHSVLNMAKFWIWEGSQYASVTQRSEYGEVLNMGGFSICERYTAFWICQNMICQSSEHIIMQKQPPEVLCKKGVLRNFAKFTGKHLCRSLFFNKVAGACNWATASYHRF